MIRINLVPQRRPKHTDQGQQSLLVGVFAIIVAGAAVFFLVDRPLADELDVVRADVAALERENKEKQAFLKDLPGLEEAVKETGAQNQTIQRLSSARVLPAHLMWELSNLLRSSGSPTMTKKALREMAEKRRELNYEWDATHVWITQIKEKDGAFTLTGGAQSDSDMTQLALRMQASVYFREVVPEGGAVAIDKESGITYYKFTIAGKVAY